MERAQTFIGFASLEAWAEAIDPQRPVLAMPLIQSGIEKGGLRVDELLVVCQQVREEGSVLYCRLRAASLTRCYGEPFDPDWREREAAWNSLADAVESHLTQRGFTLQRATVAWPRDHVFLEGRADSIRFDRETQRYRRSAQAPQPPEADGPQSASSPG